MGVHQCHAPRRHRCLILGGTVLSFHLIGVGVMMTRWMPTTWTAGAMVGWLVTTWLVMRLLQWRCQGAPRTGRMVPATVLLVASAALLGRDKP